MTKTLRFDNRVAIVTGAGGNPSLGRAYARLLASRGAKVVVNDLGVGMDGRGMAPTSAQAVVDEIVAEGGEAIADNHSVADEAGARAVVQTALDTWGRIDVLINNAGVCYMAAFDEIVADDLQRMVDVHLLGGLWMCRAAWGPMRNAGYGRIVNTTSGAMFGEHDNTIYGAAKAGVFGLTRGLALEGQPFGIRVNAVGPAAATAAAQNASYFTPEALAAFSENFPPEAVAAVACYLSHESCEVSGALLQAASGDVVATLFGHTSGHHDPGLTLEGVADHIDAIFDSTDLELLNDPRDPAAADRDTGGMVKLRPYQPPSTRTDPPAT